MGFLAAGFSVSARKRPCCGWKARWAGFSWMRMLRERPIIFVAGGTGFAPIKGMLRHLFRQGLKRPMYLFWGARQEIDLYEHGLIGEWLRERPAPQYTPVLSEAADQDSWAGAKAWVHQAVLKAYPDLAGHQVYLSGPPQMIGAARVDFSGPGLPEDHLHFDSFEYALD